MRSKITLWLISINVALILTLGWLWLSPFGQRSLHWVPPSAVKPQLSSAPESQAASGVASRPSVASAERPVFSATRRPVSAVLAPPAPSRADPLDSVRLFGVFSGSDGGGAIVSSEGKTRRMKISDLVGDWRLQKVRDKEVIFARGTETRVISLIPAKPGQTARSGPPSLPVQPQSVLFPQVAPPTSAAQASAGAPPKPANSPAKPAPGFVIGGSR